MKLFRHLMLPALAMSIAIGLADDYNPENPPEPGGEPGTGGTPGGVPLYIISNPEDIGYFYPESGELHQPGSLVEISAWSNHSEFEFSHWSLEDGTVYSTDEYTSICMPSTPLRLTANFRYIPDNPDEPTVAEHKSRLFYNISPSEGGHVNIENGSYYSEGEIIYVYATPNSEYTFEGWLLNGDPYVETRGLYHTKSAEDETLTALFRYTPNSPSEPTSQEGTSRLFYRIVPAGGGTVNFTNGSSYVNGSSVYVKATAATDFVFDGWLLDGESYSSANSFFLTKGTKDETLTAKFKYAPRNPNEPSANYDTFAFYGRRTAIVPGQTTMIPVFLENYQNVTGLSVDVSIPEGFTVNSEGVSIAERASGMTLSVSNVESEERTLRVGLSSESPLAGVNGPVFHIPVIADPDLEIGEVYTIGLSKGVVYTDTGTAHTVTARNGYLITVAAPDEPVKSPDYRVSDVRVDNVVVMPGQSFDVRWEVSNIGELPAPAGWIESVAILDANGKNVTVARMPAATDPLATGMSIQRRITATIPDLPGIDGELDIRVTLVAPLEAGEPDDRLDNNSCRTSNTPVNLGRRLYLTLPEDPLEEAMAGMVKCRLARSGNWTESEDFTIAAEGDGRVTAPAKITIPKNQSAAYFYLSVIDNDDNDGYGSCDISVYSERYAPATGTIHVVDDELPTLSLKVEPETIVEGEDVKLTITASRAPTADLAVSVTSDSPAKFPILKVTIPAGQYSASAIVTCVDNKIPETEQWVTFTASAPGYEEDTADITVKDNDVPKVALKLSPNAVSEADGPRCVTATLSRLDNVDKSATFKILHDAGNNLSLECNTVTFSPGESQKEFLLGPVDNSIVDGERLYHITASLWIASCSCNIASTAEVGTVTSELTVLDNDGPTLSLSSPSSSLKEGGEIKVTVSRNTPPDTSLEVTLSATHDERLQYPRSVVMERGRTSADFMLKALANMDTADGFTFTLTAEAEGYTRASSLFMVTDQTLPDAKVVGFSASASEIEVGSQVALDVTIQNCGSAVLPAMTPVGFYLDSDSELSAVAYLADELLPDETVTVTRMLTVPSRIGSHTVYAVVNSDRKIKELIYTNNTSATLLLNSVSPYRCSVSVDKDVCVSGDAVKISGNLEGKYVEGQRVEVYIINNGYRDNRYVGVREDGSFELTYEPYPNQMGHFSVGACYPEENVGLEMASFDVYGMRLKQSGYLTHDTFAGDEVKGSFSVKNPGQLPLTNIRVESGSVPDGLHFETSVDKTTLPAGQEALISYTLKGDNATLTSEWSKLLLRVVSDQAEVSNTLYYVIRNPYPDLRVDNPEIETTMAKGASRSYKVRLANHGKGETGPITLSMPSCGWLGTSTPVQIGSLAYGEGVDLYLTLAPTEAEIINIPVTAKIGVNCENGNGTVISIKATPVSEATGSVTVDVRDEWTYASPEAPRVAGANVVLKTYGGTVVQSQVTGDDGFARFVLNEGYYRICVSADRHDYYEGNLMVEPGVSTEKIVNINYQAIEVSFDVVETEIEDLYVIENNVSYETNVPKPVVVIDGPSAIDGDNMGPGDKTLVTFNLTNVGLLRAENMRFILPEATEEWLFEALAPVGPMPLEAHESISIPVLITHYPDGKTPQQVRRNTDAVSTMNGCMAHMVSTYEQICEGQHLADNKSAWGMSMKLCASAALMGSLANLGGIGSDFGGGGGGGSGPGDPDNPNRTNYDDYWDSPHPMDTDKTFCNPCYTDMMGKVLDGVLDKTPLSYINDGANLALERTGGPKHVRLDSPKREDSGEGKPGSLRDKIADYGKSAAEDMIKDKVQDAMGELGELMGLGAPVADAIDDAKKYSGYIDEFEKCNALRQSGGTNPPQQNVRSAETNLQSGWVQAFADAIEIYSRQLEATLDIQTELFGDPRWLAGNDATVRDFWIAVSEQDEIEPLDVDVLAPRKPVWATYDDLQKFVDRLNNEDSIEFDTNLLSECLSTIQEVDALAREAGFANCSEMFMKRQQEFLEMGKQGQSSVCSTVKLSFKQNVAMTRQAFRGTLSINNNADAEMKDINLQLTVRKLDGQLMTSHEFQITVESLSGFDGQNEFNGGWRLPAESVGQATVLYIPTKYAAPQQPEQYEFGGTLSFIDPYSGQFNSYNLTPVVLTVKPTAELCLDYFIQRDIIGDDPFTEAIEPSEDAEFALLINNKGYGDATKVTISMGKPEIISNDKGLLVDFDIVASQLNGNSRVLALDGNSFVDVGTIDAHSSAYAQWWFRSSLLGHFTEYEVSYNHVTSYDNPDLSLIDKVESHELIRSVSTKSDGKETTVFLVNDIADANDYPDTAYSTDGTSEEVSVASDIQLRYESSNVYTLTLAPEKAGWIYSNLPDPTSGSRRLASVVRKSDSSELGSRNFWQTNVTLRDGLDNLYEDRLHIADKVASAEPVSYTLTFVDKPELELSVESIDGFPVNGVTDQQVKDVTVTFNKEIDFVSLKPENLSLSFNGTQLDLSGTAISEAYPFNGRAYKLDISQLTSASGYYMLTFNLDGIYDTYGYTGRGRKTYAWEQALQPGSVASVNVDDDIKITPLPMEDFVRIEGASEIHALAISDINGRMWLNLLNIEPGADIDIRDLAPGFYILNIETADGKTSLKAFKR